MSVTVATYPIIVPRTNPSHKEHNYPISEIKFTTREKRRNIFGDDDDTCSLTDVSLLTLETKKPKKATGRLVPLSRVIEILEEEYDCVDDEPSLKDACRLWCRHVKDFVMHPVDKTYSCVSYASKHRYHLLLSLATKGLFVWCIHAAWTAAAAGRPNPTDYIVRDAHSFGGDVSLSQQRQEQRSIVHTSGLATQPPIRGAPLRSLQSNPPSAGKSDAELTIEDDTSIHNENVGSSNGEVERQAFDSNHRSSQRQPPGLWLRHPDDQLETPPVQDENNGVPNHNESHGSADTQSNTFGPNHRNIQRQPPGWRPRRSDHHVDTPVLVLAATEDLQKIFSILGNGQPHN